MILYVTPKQAPPQGEQRPVITCDSHESASAAMKTLKAQGWGNGYSITRGDVVCDFCSTPGITKLYSIRAGGHLTTTPDGVNHMDEDGLWGACPPCHALISADNWNGLRKRSVDLFMAASSLIPRVAVEMSVQAAHDFFRRGWIAAGSPEPSSIITDDEIMGA